MRGVRGGGTVYQKTRVRKDGGTRVFWVAQIYTPIDGKMKRIEGQGPTPTAAVLARGRAVARAEEGLTRTPHPTTQRGTLAALMTDWNDTRVVKPRTREHTASVIKNHILPEKIGQKALRAVRGADVQRLLLTRESDWTRVAVFKALRSFMTFALQGGMLKTDPLKTIPRPKMPKAKLANGEAMDEAVSRLTAMLKWMRSTGWTQARPMYWARIMLALEGLRPGEARGLRWSDVEHLEHGGDPPRIVVRKQLGYAEHHLQLTDVKGGTPRIVMLRGQTAEALLAWQRERERLSQSPTWRPRPGLEDLVLAYDNGRPLRQQDDSKEWRDILKEAQKEDDQIALWPTAYMRHVAVTLMRDSGVAASLVAAMMGHSIAVEDSVYWHSRPAAQVAAAKQMDSMLEERTRPEGAPDFAEKLLNSLGSHPTSEPLRWEDIFHQDSSQKEAQDGPQSDSEG